MKKQIHTLSIIPLILLIMSACNNKNITAYTVNWDNKLVLPPANGSDQNIGYAGAFSGFVGDKLVMIGGANFPNGYPWEGGTKKWWTSLFSISLSNENEE